VKQSTVELLTWEIKRPRCASNQREQSPSHPIGKGFQPVNLEKWITDTQYSTLYQTLVTFVVGKADSKQTFTVHKDFATSHSPVFYTAFHGGFAESKSQQLVLEDVDPKVFGFLVHWLYHQKVEDGTEESGKCVVADQLMLFAKLWELGQQFMIRPLQDDAISRIFGLLQITKFDNGEDMAGLKEFIKFVYRDELRDSALAKVAIDKVALDIKSADLDLYCWFEEMPARLWYDITMYLKEAREVLVA
jgi:hypothetical protein